MSFISFSTYQPPGVIVQQVSTPTVNVISGLAVPVVGIVGPSLGYKTSTETQLLGAVGSLTTLNHTGINQNSIVVSNSAGTPYENTEYTLGTIDGASTPYNQTTITPAAGGISPNTVVYITYQYTDENYFLPTQYANANGVIADFGHPFTSSGAIGSPISLAASLAFLNGASLVAVCPTADVGTVTDSGGFSGVATVDNLQAAYANIETLTNVTLLVPLPVGIGNGNATGVGSGLASYLEAQASSGAGLIVGLVGFDTSVTTDPGVLANSFPDQRTITTYPNQMLYYNGQNNVTISGYYLAAALAGIVAGGQPQTPLTHKAVGGFAGIPPTVLQPMTLAQKNVWSSSGVTVVESNPNSAATGIPALWVRQGVTTSTTSEQTQEISLVREADAIVQSLITNINQSGVIGSAFEAATISTLTSLVQGLLNNLQDEGVIASYDSLSVTQSTTTPVVAEIAFNYTPAYPLNYVEVQFGVDANGLTTSSTATSTGSSS